MAQPLDDVDKKLQEVRNGSPPLQFGTQRLYYQYSVAIPQIQLVLASVLQGIVFSILLVTNATGSLLPNLNPKVFFLFQMPYLLSFFQQQYFYLPYIVTALIAIVAWMDFVYANAVLIWPPTPIQAILILFLTVAEIAMASNVGPGQISLWRSAVGLTTVVGGIMRWNNVRVFTKSDFEDPVLGKIMLDNEKKYGTAYILLGGLGIVIGLSYYVILGWVQTWALLHWLQGSFPALSADRFLHWILYVLILFEIFGVLYMDSRYRQFLLKRLTQGWPLEVTPHGGIRHKIPENMSKPEDQAGPKTTAVLSRDEDTGDDGSGRGGSGAIPPEPEDKKAEKRVEVKVEEQANVEGQMSVPEDITTSDRKHLYYLWERGQWSVQNINFAQDRLDWLERLTNKQRLAIRSIVFMFLDGEQIVARDLVPFVRAASRLEDRVFLTTQMADEGKHHVFFDRFLREVVGVGYSMESALAEVQPYLSSSYRQLFAELDHVAEQLRQRPEDAPLLTQALVLYHLMAEGIAHTGQHFLSAFGTKTKLLPGLTLGMKLIARDESRHIAFGLLLLRELITTNPECRTRAIQTIRRVLPWATSMLFLPEFIHSLGISNREACIFTLRTLGTRFRRIGISLDETQLAGLGHADSPEEQADSLLILMESGVFASDGDLHITKDTMDVMFNGIHNILAKSQTESKGLSAAIQWIFDELPPRYLLISSEKGVQTEVGTIKRRNLTLRVAAADWARIVLGQLHPIKAMFTGRLRVSGNWRVALRLSRILSAQWQVE